MNWEWPQYVIAALLLVRLLLNAHGHGRLPKIENNFWAALIVTAGWTALLWAGGFFMQAIYQMVGIRENSWNLYLTPDLPTGFTPLEFDVFAHGRLCHIRTNGTGKFFRSIKIDGKVTFSVVINRPAQEINLTRGVPEYPYLAQADAIIRNVNYFSEDKKFVVEYNGFSGQEIRLSVISPFPIKKMPEATVNVSEADNIYQYSIKTTAKDEKKLILWFK